MRRVISIVIMFMSFNVMFAYVGTGASPSWVFDTLNPEVELLTPTPGEIWYVGQAREISWSAFDTNLAADSIRIHYSLDGGASYQPITIAASNTGTYSFDVPGLTSDAARIRITATDTFGNYSRAANPLIWAYAVPQPAQYPRVRISGLDAVIEWDPVTETVYNDPVIPDGYMLFQGDTANQDPDEYELLAITPDTSYTYLNAAGYYDRKFFFVVAYKGDIGRLAVMLEESGKIGSTGLTMAGARQYLRYLHLRAE